jgi:hypothetical protein
MVFVKMGKGIFVSILLENILTHVSGFDVPH